MRISKSLLLLILLYFAVRIPWMYMVPMVKAPDEFSHYWVFKFMVLNLRLPSAMEVAAGGPSAVYGSLPQLGYLPHILACEVCPIDNIALVGRFGSLFIGLIALVASYYLGIELFTSSLFALAVPLALVFHPQYVQVNSYSNNDITTTAIVSVVILLFVRALKKSFNLKEAALLGFLLGWAALSKYSGYAIYPTSLVALSLIFFIHRFSARKISLFLSVIGGVFGLTCGWWFLRNYQEFNGDYLGTKTMFSTWAKTYGKATSFWKPPWAVMKDKAWWRMTAFSFWGLFGYMNMFLWRPIYFGYIGFMLISAFSGLYGLVRGVMKTDFKMLLSERERCINPAIWTVLFACGFSNIAAMVAASTVNLGGPQGRYLFASEAPLMALLIAGLARLGGKYGSRLVIAFLIFNAIICVHSFFWLYQEWGGFRTVLYDP